MIRKRVAATALALAVGALTLKGSSARADAPEPEPRSQSTPLVLRPTKPIELARDPAHAGLGWKLAAFGLVLGGAGLAFRRRFNPERVEGAKLFVAKRTAIGIRSELLIVNVEGQRLLLGVTPHSIQTLAVLDPLESPACAAQGASPEGAAKDDAALESERDPLSPRFAAMLASASQEDELDMDSQARGLHALRRPR